MNQLKGIWKTVLDQYELPSIRNIRHPGGTASPKLLLETEEGSFIVRRRPDGMTQPGFVRFDHAWRAYLAGKSFPVAALVPAGTGLTWVDVEGTVYELSRYVVGSLSVRPDPSQLRNAGRALAAYHSLGEGFREPGKEGFPREDHISVLKPLLDGLYALAPDGETTSQLNALTGELEEVSGRLEGGLYESLEQGVIHGDFHAGNMLFRGPAVAAFIDLDYANREAILRDIGDAFVSLAADHGSVYNPDDIWSLTQSWTLNRARMLTFLEGYREVRLLPSQPHCLALLMLSRWIQVRLRGSRKVDDHQKIELVFKDFWKPVRYLKERFPAFLDDVLNDLG